MLNDIIKHVGKEKKIILDLVLKNILDEYRGLSGGKNICAPVMNSLTDKINNLVKDL